MAVVVGLVGCGGSGGGRTTASLPAETTPAVPKPETHVVVHETEFKLDPANAAGGDAGLVAIKIVNDGHVAHSLAVDGPNGEVELDGDVAPGHTAALEADLDQPGTYTWYCPLDGHRAKGMSGTITVGGSSPARGAEGQSTTVTTGTTPTQTVTPTQTQTSTRTQTQTQTQTTTTPTQTSTTPTATTGSGSGSY